MNKKSIISIALVLLCAISAFAEETLRACVLQNEMALWKEKSEGMMEWAKIDLEAGEKIEAFITGKDDDGNPLAVTKRSSWTNAKEGQTLLFAKVKYKKETYYAIANRIAIGYSPAMLLEDAATYSSKNPADIRKKAVKQGTIIGLDITDKTDGAELSLVKMAYYDEGAYVKREGYVLNRKVTSNKDDISAYALLKQAEKESDQARKEAILSSISQLDTSAEIKALAKSLGEDADKLKDLTNWGIIDVETDENDPDANFCIIDEMGSRRADEPYNFEDLGNVNLRSLPGLDGEVVGQLKLSRGHYIKKTAKTVTIDGITDHWYYFQNDMGDEGWVFGAYLRNFYISHDEY